MKFVLIEHVVQIWKIMKLGLQVKKEFKKTIFSYELVS